MNNIGQFIQNLPAPLAKTIIIVFGLLALYLAFKIAHFILKILFGFIGLGLLVWVFWRLFFNQ